MAWAPGIQNHGTAFSEADGFEYNYLCLFPTEEQALGFARKLAEDKTPAAKRRKGEFLAHTAKEVEDE